MPLWLYHFFRGTSPQFPHFQALEQTDCISSSVTRIIICRLTCGVVLQHRVLAEGLVSPGDRNFLEVGRRWKVTAQDHRGKQHRSHFRVWNAHLDGEKLWQKQEELWNKMDDYQQQPQTLFTVILYSLTSLCITGLWRIWTDLLTLHVHAGVNALCCAI